MDTMQIEQEDATTWRFTCKQCEHFMLVSPDAKKKFENDSESLHCELCYTEPGQPKRLTRSLIHCGNCNQTFDSKGSCSCPIETSSIKVVFDPDHKWISDKRWNSNPESYNAKTTRDYNLKTRNRKVEAEERQIRVDKNLIEMVKLMKKMVNKK